MAASGLVLAMTEHINEALVLLSHNVPTPHSSHQLGAITAFLLREGQGSCGVFKSLKTCEFMNLEITLKSLSFDI